MNTLLSSYLFNATHAHTQTLTHMCRIYIVDKQRQRNVSKTWITKYFVSKQKQFENNSFTQRRICRQNDEKPVLKTRSFWKAEFAQLSEIRENLQKPNKARVHGFLFVQKNQKSRCKQRNVKWTKTKSPTRALDGRLAQSLDFATHACKRRNKWKKMQRMSLSAEMMTKTAVVKSERQQNETF